MTTVTTQAAECTGVCNREKVKKRQINGYTAYTVKRSCVLKVQWTLLNKYWLTYI